MHKVDVCIVGAGPAGSALGVLLASKGVKVAILERETEIRPIERGALIQPGTLPLFHKMGILDKLEKYSFPIEGIETYGNRGRHIITISYKEIRGPFQYGLAVNYYLLQRFLLEKANEYSSFRLFLGAEVLSITKNEKGKVVGLKAKIGKEEVEFEADLVVAADGRNSVVRRMAGIDTIKWDFDHQHIMLMVERPDNWPSMLRLYRDVGKYIIIAPVTDQKMRVLYAIPSGTFDQVKEEGLSTFIEKITETVPDLRDSLKKLKTWDHVMLHTFRCGIAEKWVDDGILLLGDSAHSIHAFGAQGMNFSIQDAIVATPVIIRAIEKGVVTRENLLFYEEERKPYITKFAQRQAKTTMTQLQSKKGVVLTQRILRILRLFKPYRVFFAEMVAFGPRKSIERALQEI